MAPSEPPPPNFPRRAPRLDGERLLAEIPALAIEAFRAAPPIVLPAKPTLAMGGEELQANRKIETVRPAAGPAGLRGLGRAFRRNPVPPYQVTARAAMVEALLRGPCRPADRKAADRLMEFSSNHPVWVCLHAYLKVVHSVKFEEVPPIVLAAAGDAVHAATRAGDPLGMANRLRGIKATLQQAAAEVRSAAGQPKPVDRDGPEAKSAPCGAKGGRSKFYTVPESAAWLGIGERSVWRRISEGDIHVTHLGSRITRIAFEELEKFAAKRGRGRGSR